MTSRPRACDPFEPAGVEWRHVSGRLVAARLVVVLPFIGVPLVAAALVAVLVTPWAWIAVATLAGIAVWAALVIPRQVRAMKYAERADDLLVRRGVMFRSMVVVPYGRMQYVDVQAGPLDRAMRIARVQLHTASTQTDASIDGLEPAEAERLRDRLASRGEARLAGL